MRVLVVSGIWPPDVGGPASHAPEVARHLRGRDHTVEAVITADAPPAEEPYPVRWVSRRLPAGVRHIAVVLEIFRHARAADVVYATGMFARAAVASSLARRPLVVKLTGDPAFERARWRGLVGGDVESFGAGVRRPSVVALRALRTWTLRRAAAVVCPSEYLRRFVPSWGVPADRAVVIPNPVPDVGMLPDRADLRRTLGVGNGVVLAYAGRFGPQKALGNAVDAVGVVEGVTLLIAGAGGDEPALAAAARESGARVRLLGPQSREHVLELLAAADAMVLPSLWENLPHSVLESLGVGTPVIATAVGGVPELVEDGTNGLLVPPGDVGALAAAFVRFRDDSELRLRLQENARGSVAAFSRERTFGELEALLERVRA